MSLPVTFSSSLSDSAKQGLSYLKGCQTPATCAPWLSSGYLCDYYRFKQFNLLAYTMYWCCVSALIICAHVAYKSKYAWYYKQLLHGKSILRICTAGMRQLWVHYVIYWASHSTSVSDPVTKFVLINSQIKRPVTLRHVCKVRWFNIRLGKFIWPHPHLHSLTGGLQINTGAHFLLCLMIKCLFQYGVGCNTKLKHVGCFACHFISFNMITNQIVNQYFYVTSLWTFTIIYTLTNFKWVKLINNHITISSFHNKM